MDTIDEFEKKFVVEDGEYKKIHRPSERIGSPYHKTTNQVQKVSNLVLYCLKCEEYIEPKVKSSDFSYVVSCLNEGCGARSDISAEDLKKLVELTKQKYT